MKSLVDSEESQPIFLLSINRGFVVSVRCFLFLIIFTICCGI